MAYIFGGNTGLTYEQLQQRRKALEARKNVYHRPRTAGEGLSALGYALGTRLENNRLAEAETARRGRADQAFSAFRTILGGGTPANPSSGQPAGAQAQSGGPPGGMGGGLDPRLIDLMGNPDISPQRRSAMQILFQQHLKGTDPMRQIQLERAQIELDRMRNPQPDPMKEIQLQQAQLKLEQMRNPERKIIKGADGFQYYQDTGERVLPNVEQQVDPMKPLQVENAELQNEGLRRDLNAPAKREIIKDINGRPRYQDTGELVFGDVEAQPGYQMLSPDQVQEMGLPAGSYQQGPKGRVSQIGGKGTNVTVNTQAEKQLHKERGKGLGGRLNTIAEDGMKALDDLSTINRLGDLLGGVETGLGTAGAAKFAEMTGLDWFDEKTPKLQAIQALVSYMAPRMRVAGSGSSSDKDIAVFFDALPGLMKTPEGNEKITQTLGGMAQRRADLGEIAIQWQLGEITAAQAHQRMQELPDPFEQFKKSRSGKTEPNGGGGWVSKDGNVRIRVKPD